MAETESQRNSLINATNSKCETPSCETTTAKENVSNSSENVKGYIDRFSPFKVDDAPTSEPLLEKNRSNDILHDLQKDLKSVANPVEFDSALNVPIDRGWAWVILIAFVATHFIIIGQLKCFGIVFVHLQDRYGSSSSATSLIYTLMNASYSIAALFILTVGGSLPERKCVTIGALIASVASMITAFISDVHVAMVTIGIANGIANAFIMPTFSTLVSTYFVKRRGFANNIGNSGVSLGAIAFAPILTMLFERFGYTGTYIWISGVNLQLFVMAALLRPMNFYTKAFNSKQTDLADTKEIQDSHQHGDKARSLLYIHEDNEKIELNGFSYLKDELQTSRRRYFSESEAYKPFRKDNGIQTSERLCVNSARFASTDVINNSMLDLTLTRLPLKDTSDKSWRPVSITSTILHSFKKLFDRKLLSTPVFLYYLICNMFLCAGGSLASAFLPPFAVDYGISNDLIALMVSVQMAVDFSSRFLFGYISDKNICHRSTLIAISTLILGIAAQFLHFMTTFSTVIIYAITCGLLQGVYFSLFVVVILDILSFDDLKGALGFISLAQGISSGICVYVVGKIRDETGNYAYTFNFVGFLLLAGAVLVYFVPNVHSWSQRREVLKENKMLKDT